MRTIIFSLLLTLSACSKQETPETSPDTTITTGTTGTTGTTSGSFFPAETGNFQNDMLAYVNALRTKGCKCDGVQMPLVPALKWNKLLENSSIRHGKDMLTNNFFSHTGSDGSSMSKRATDAGYKWSALSENIAWGYKSLPSVIDGWVKSGGHCRNIMSATYTEMGAAKAGDYWVQDFGKPTN